MLKIKHILKHISKSSNIKKGILLQPEICSVDNITSHDRVQRYKRTKSKDLEFIIPPKKNDNTPAKKASPNRKKRKQNK